MAQTTTNEGREQALAWIRRQLSWERTLAELRAGRVEGAEETRKAA